MKEMSLQYLKKKKALKPDIFVFFVETKSDWGHKIIYFKGALQLSQNVYNWSVCLIFCIFLVWLYLKVVCSQDNWEIWKGEIFWTDGGYKVCAKYKFIAQSLSRSEKKNTFRFNLLNECMNAWSETK